MRQHAQMPQRSRPSSRIAPLVLVLALGAFGVVLVLTSVPGPFTVDEANYLVTVIGARQGSVHVPNTAGLLASRELLFFDPVPWTRTVNQTPVTSVAPPLYAWLALPFSFAGWRGLVALNVIGYLTSVACVFFYTREHATRTLTPWLAAGTVALGAFLTEYAQGLWPHAVSLGLCTAALYLANAEIGDGNAGAIKPSLSRTALAGFLLGLAAGVRYQNAVLIAASGLGLLIWSTRRLKAILAFSCGAAVPLLVSAFINHARFDSWNPISKGPGYLNVPVPDAGHSLFEPLVMFWSLVIDFTARPLLTEPDVETWWKFDAATHTHLMFGVVEKKALLQSAPWAVVALMFLVTAWLPRRPPDTTPARQLRFISLLVGVVFATFAVAGVARHDGLSFNQRYFLEVLPPLAVAFAWAMDDGEVRYGWLWAGCGATALLTGLLLVKTPVASDAETALLTFRHAAIMRVPLVLAGLMATAWLTRQRARTVVSVAAGVCLGWACLLHLASDVAASRVTRTTNYIKSRALDAILPDHSAVVAWWANKEAVVPLLLDRDVVVLNAQTDDAEAAPYLVEQLRAENRRVFVIADGFPAATLDRVLAAHGVSNVATKPLDVRELH
jgi:hypothetical protein